MPRPRRHDYNIPKGLPLSIYKRALRVEERLDKNESKREDQLIQLIKEANIIIRRLAKQVGRLKELPIEVYHVIGKQANVVKYHESKKLRRGNNVQNFIPDAIDKD